jgi:hypothetical protein
MIIDAICNGIFLQSKSNATIFQHELLNPFSMDSGSHSIDDSMDCVPAAGSINTKRMLQLNIICD